MAAAPTNSEQIEQRASWRAVAACCVAGCAVWIEPPASIFRPPAELAFGSGWVSYNLVLGIIDLYVIVLFLVGGTVGDIFGRRRTLMVGLAGATLGNLLLVLSPSIEWFVATRVLVGMASALVMPLSLSLVHLAFERDSEQRDRAITLYIVVTAIAVIVAGVIGGLFRSLADWRLAFVPPIVLALAGFVLVYRRVPESKALPHERYVAVGNTASTWILLALAFGLHVYWVAGEYAIYVLLGSLAAVALGILLLLRADYRASGSRLALHWRRRWHLTVLTVFGVAMNIGATGFLTQTFGAVRAVYGYTTLVAVLALAPFVVGVLLVSRPAFQRWTARLGHREMMASGMCLVALSCLAIWLLFGTRSYLVLAVPMLAFGVGSTMANSAWTARYLRSVSGELIGARTGMNTAISRTGDIVGTALTSALLAMIGTRDYIGRLREEGLAEDRVRQAADALNGLLDPATVNTAAVDPVITGYLLAGYRLSYTLAFERVMLVLALISLLASALAWLALQPSDKAVPVSATAQQDA
jgi:MFS transporter, DHA2 family, methylenomycin A resistance protein